uniref:Uncharacterized protein n=1 Tax=Anguilla anguilla TaxID=7936 RepID=A0A0E9P8Y3_ANGAN
MKPYWCSVTDVVSNGLLMELLFLPEKMDTF